MSAINEQEECLFEINFWSDITPALLTRYRGDLYDITRVDCFGGYKEDLKLYAKRRA